MRLQKLKNQTTKTICGLIALTLTACVTINPVPKSHTQQAPEDKILKRFSNGNIKEVETWEDNDTNGFYETRVFTEYDINGKKILQRRIDNKLRIWAAAKYHWNSKGQLLSQEVKSSLGSHQISNFQYDENGWLSYASNDMNGDGITEIESIWKCSPYGELLPHKTRKQEDHEFTNTELKKDCSKEVFR